MDGSSHRDQTGSRLLPESLHDQSNRLSLELLLLSDYCTVQTSKQRHQDSHTTVSKAGMRLQINFSRLVSTSTTVALASIQDSAASMIVLHISHSELSFF